MRSSHLAAALAPFVLIGLLVALFAAPPDVRPASSPPDMFSAERALAHVRGLTSTGKPHPAAHYDGSPRTAEEIADHDRARDWVQAQLRDLGLTPELQRGRSCGRFTCADVENVLARIDGTEAGPALLLMAHYDSTPYGPGAADDGAGVATLLETIRALKTDGPHRRTLLILIDDGEEMGLLGARAFTKEHPWAEDVGVVLNFEARGTSGQVAMFETSPDNGWLIDMFARNVERPVASSLIYTAYKRLPNDTDLTILKQAGKQGLNFAFADSVFNYHTPGDTDSELDPRSLQHMGDQALSMSRAFLTAEKLHAPAPDAVYFDLFTHTLVHYPAAVSGPLAAVAAIAAAYALYTALKRRRTSAARLVMATVMVLGSIVAAGAAGIGLGALFKKVRFPDVGTGPLAMRAMMGDKHSFPPWLALVALGAAVSLAFVLWLAPRSPSGADKGHASKDEPASDKASASRDRSSADKPSALEDKPASDKPSAAGPADAVALTGGALVVWTALSTLLGFTLPGASYLFTWPVFGLAGSLILLAPAASPSPWRRTAAVVNAALPAALLWLPIVRVLLIMVGPTVAPAAVVPVALLGSLLTPVLAVSPPRMKWALPLAGAAVSLVAAGLSFANVG
ncbi:MAG: M20/M25/M40 family metallo-hydrolase [Polyangiaceae bacterium]